MSLGSGKSYSQKALLAKQLPEAILNYFFSQIDLLDLLNLQSFADCERYIFTTAKALDTVFTRLQVHPERGKNGEIYYIPMKQVSFRKPEGLSPEDQRTFAERKQQRDRLCLDISYFYVRIFQIYAALALTTMNTDPTRQRLGPVAFPIKQGTTRSAPLMSGGAESALSTYDKQILFGRDLVPILKSKPLAALTQYAVKFRPNSSGISDYIELPLKIGRPMFHFLVSVDSMRSSILNGNPNEDQVTGLLFSDSTQSVYRDSISIQLKRTQSNQILLWIDGQQLAEFYFSSSDQIYKTRDGNFAEILTSWIKINAPDLPGLLATTSGPVPSAPPGVPSYYPGAPSSSGSSAGFQVASSSAPSFSISSGSSFYDQGEYKALLQLYDDRMKQKEFPKAFCVARAMTLLNPIFPEELPNKKSPFLSQVFLRKDLDFERGLRSPMMPNPSLTIKRNLYYRSLVGLYYDDFQLAGDKVVFTQTESGRSELRQDSKKLATIYGISQDPESFLESSSTFPPVPFTDKTTQDRRIAFTHAPLHAQLLAEIVGPMLALQEAHTQKVNALLKQMFQVKFKTAGGQTSIENLLLQPVLKRGGISGLNVLGQQARRLLLDYYMKSEALYFKGIYTLMDNRKFLTLS